MLSEKVLILLFWKSDKCCLFTFHELCCSASCCTVLINGGHKNSADLYRRVVLFSRYLRPLLFCSTDKITFDLSKRCQEILCLTVLREGQIVSCNGGKVIPRWRLWEIPCHNIKKSVFDKSRFVILYWPSHTQRHSAGKGMLIENTSRPFFFG